MTQYFGQAGEDKLIKTYFPPNYIGKCIEIGGGNNGVTHSNTFHFENLGWECLVIEAQPSFYEGVKANRKNVLNYAVSNENNDAIDFTVVCCNGQPWGGMSSLQVDQRLVELHREMGFVVTEEVIKVPARRVDWCIENHFNYPTIDFISIDTEGTELDVLKSFDVNKYNIKLLIIENNFGDKGIEDYLKSCGWRKDNTLEQNEFYVRA